jgi:hypothetical protein
MFCVKYPSFAVSEIFRIKLCAKLSGKSNIVYIFNLNINISGE